MNPMNRLSGTSVSKLGTSLLVFVALLLSACGGGGGGDSTTTPPAATPTLTSIAITSSAATINAGATATFTATGNYSNGSTANITGQVTWASSLTSVATIAASGVATGVAAGTTTVTATLGEITSNAVALNVITLSSIAINPATATVTEGLTTSFSATGTYSNGTTADLTTQVTWGVTMASGSATIGSNTGVATGGTAGNGTVTAALGAITAAPSASLTVILPTITLTQIDITSPTSPASTPKGVDVPFTATGTFSDASTADISGSVTWNSTDTAVATLDASGIATPLAVGATTISASSGAINSTNTVTLNVTGPALATLTISPTPSTVQIGDTLAFQVSGTLTDGTAATAATWGTLSWVSSGSPTIATINGIGTASGVDVGTSNISVSSAAGVGGATVTSNTSVLAVTLKQLGGARQGKPMTLTTAVTTPVLSGAGATLFAPSGITTDGTYLYVADTSNHAIRKINIATGAATTLAGAVGFSGFQDGTGTAATFNLPEGITTDGTNVYVADTVNNKIRKIVISTGTVSTLAGSGSPGSANGTGTAASFNNPRGITVDKLGNLYVADTGNSSIRKIVISTGVVSNFNTQMSSPRSITTDGTNLYVANTGNNTIQQIVISTAVATTLAGSGSPGSADGTGALATFNAPAGITTDGTNLYVADTESNKIRQVVISSGVVTTLAGSGTAGTADNATGTLATFNRPYGITTDGTSLFTAGNSSNKIRKID